MTNIQFPGKHRLGAWCGALVMTLSMAACGGGSGSGAAPVNGTPAVQGPTGSTGTAAASGGGTAAPPGTATGTPTLSDQIAALEQSGAYPKLDRSTDIAGPDANSNGVRDDIEAWIYSLKLNDAQTKALMQDARVTRRTLLINLDDKGAVQKSGDELMAALNCGSRHFSPYREYSKLAGQIEAMTANTRQRAERYMLYNKAASGTSNTLPDGDTCEP
ncbi:hypothetical protein [Xenophilus sp.]|uniref:hypothetical protein n=1 Tax=Xenophilus sp. TaxID=1873499 RepID=UPI0037DC7E73